MNGSPPNQKPFVVSLWRPRPRLIHRRLSLSSAMARSVLKDILLRRTLSSSPSPSLSTSVFLRQFQTNSSSSESTEDFERRLLGLGTDDPLDPGVGRGGRGGRDDPFFRRLDRAERSYARSRAPGGDEGDAEFDDSLDDGMDEELKKSCRGFFKHSDEIYEEDYAFRPDVQFREGDTYTVKDLDLTKPAARRPPQKREFETTTEEVLRKADFRNVRFLSNFITEAGIIIKRSQTRISAKAQRKVAREIKTARALGLMPFTSMGTKPFIFGKNMKDGDEDYEYNTYDDPVGMDDMPDVEPIRK